MQIPHLDSAYATALSFIDGAAIRTLGLAPSSPGRSLRAIREFLADPANLAKTDRIVIVADWGAQSDFYAAIPAFFPVATPKWETTLDELPTWAKDGPLQLVLRPPRAAAKFAASAAVNAKVSFWMGGDSSRLAADAIVNVANEWLAPGGGICGVIHAAAGPELAAECKAVGVTMTGCAAKTRGYNLPAKFVIHAVGPTSQDPVALKSAYVETLRFIDGGELRSVRLCCVSTGIFGYPIRPATHIALQTVREFLENEENREKTDRIVFVVFEHKDQDVYYELIPEYFPITAGTTEEH
jgi:O-acetyl-ADP-ribose deacetylase (regulator of RNase III)